MIASTAATRRVDLSILMLLALCTALYAWLWPRDLYLFDEGLVLYEAKRIREGAVIYGDFFEIITPGFLYLMAGAFALFGTSLAVARSVMAVIHIAIQWLTYGLARRLGARPEVALLAAAAELAVSYGSLPQANPHWLSTLAGLAMVVVLLRVATPRGAFWIGMASGLCLLIQQHRGTGVLVAVAAVQVVDAWAQAVDRRHRARQVVARLAAVAAGAALVVTAGLLPLAVAAGPTALYDALLRFPLQNYRQYHQSVPWGGLAIGPFATVGFVVRWVPLVIPLALTRGVVGLVRRRDDRTWRPLLVTALFAASTTAAMRYYPDYIHLAVAAPLTLALVAEGLEQLLRRTTRRLVAAAWITPVAVGIAWILADNLSARWLARNVRRETAFGTVDFGSPSEAAAMEIIARGLDAAERRETFAYPYGASLYLVANARNPTRFQFLNPLYSDPAQLNEALRTLEERRVPYVLVSTYSITWKLDPVVRYLLQAYDRVPLPPGKDRIMYAVFKRRPDIQVDPSAFGLAPTTP